MLLRDGNPLPCTAKMDLCHRGGGRREKLPESISSVIQPRISGHDAELLDRRQIHLEVAEMRAAIVDEPVKLEGDEAPAFVDADLRFIRVDCKERVVGQVVVRVEFVVIRKRHDAVSGLAVVFFDLLRRQIAVRNGGVTVQIRLEFRQTVGK